jgi:hypothetical protein
MNMIIQELFNINRPEFINISGSIVLKKILIDNNISHDWNSNDLDIYISINNISFNTFTCLDYIKDIITFLTYGTSNQTEFINNKMEDIAYNVSDIVAKEYMNKIINENINKNEIEDLDSYRSISNNIINVIKFSYENIQIDFIFIDIEIDSYIVNNFDLSIIQNYINSENNIVQFNNLNDIKESICNFNLNKLDYILSHDPKYNIKSFITRIYKYNNRGFKIYLNYLKCLCNKINCLCTIKLDYNFINIVNQGYVTYYNIIKSELFDNYLNKKYCYRKKNHSGRCKTNYTFNLNRCNKEISDLKINSYKYEPLLDVYINSKALITILNKIVLLRELHINYTLHPNNLLNIFDDLLD